MCKLIDKLIFVDYKKMHIYSRMALLNHIYLVQSWFDSPGLDGSDIIITEDFNDGALGKKLKKSHK